MLVLIAGVAIGAAAFMAIGLVALLRVDLARSQRSSIERYAVERDLVLVAVSRAFAERLQTFSNPVHVRMEEGTHPLMWQMELRPAEQPVKIEL